MAKHVVKCAVCKKEFDMNAEQAVKYNTVRYAHKDCFPAGIIVPMEASAVIDPALQELKDYISKLYGKKANWILINRQIKDYYTNEKYTYSGMKKALEYFYEINHNDPNESNGGVGIIPFVYENAYQYFYNIWLAQQNADKSFFAQVKEFIIRPPKARGTKNKLLDWWENDDEE